MAVKTEYLFGLSRSEFEPELSILANKRINAANKLLVKLVQHRDKVGPESQDMKDLQKRYRKVTKSRNFWTEILLEE